MGLINVKVIFVFNRCFLVMIFENGTFYRIQCLQITSVLSLEVIGYSKKAVKNLFAI